jgi:bifunctional DNA-binding transcriptional regulator/antitoxin component of YhaV-PrlF toxin-antitoxin module
LPPPSGYFASASGLLPGAGGSDNTAEIESALAQQSQALAALQEQVAALGSADAPTVDLSPVTDEIGALGARLEETATAIGTLTDRVTTLEERPVFTGEVSSDAAEATEARCRDGRTHPRPRRRGRAHHRRSRGSRPCRRRGYRSRGSLGCRSRWPQAEAEAALNELRLAIARRAVLRRTLGGRRRRDGTARGPERRRRNRRSEPRVDIQASFPAAARAALPVALRETAGDRAVDRLTAFVQGQIGGRAVAPREGDDPDAILSRVQAAVIRRRPGHGAVRNRRAARGRDWAEMADWIADAEARTAVTAALETVTAAVAGANQ